ncbi:MAG: hypothetical protein QMD82_02045 [bacterium]|nr:hypothetical protein [bacterium]
MSRGMGLDVIYVVIFLVYRGKFMSIREQNCGENGFGSRREE